MKFNVTKFNPLIWKTSSKDENKVKPSQEKISIEEVIRRYEEVSNK